MIITRESDLRKPTEDVTDYDEAIEICDKLAEEVNKHDGLGLAANQIGIQKKVCVTRIPSDRYYILHRFVNPVVKSASLPTLFDGEGCLSFPDSRIETIRYYKIAVEDFLFPEGRVFVGISAIAAYHEIDHLNGLTMFDRRIKSIGPNGACPCLSGKKFKKCCQGNLTKFHQLHQKLAGLESP